MTENSSIIFVAALSPASGQSTVNKTILSALLFAECPVHVHDTSPRDNKPGFTYFIRHLVPALPAAWRILAAWEGVASVYLSADSCFENEADVATIDQKQRSSFFRIADVLVFPMPYKTESYLPVIVRAAAFGQPVISFDRGCIIDNMDPSADHLVPRDADFVSGDAAPVVEIWAADRADWPTQARRQHVRSLYEQAVPHRALAMGVTGQ
jgi:glycosyltransferase involved in cell wall biosynthesis